MRSCEELVGQDEESPSKVFSSGFMSSPVPFIKEYTRGGCVNEGNLNLGIQVYFGLTGSIVHE